MNWHKADLQEIFKQLESSEKGLSTSQAQERMAREGKNVLPQGKKVTIWQVIWHQFKSPLIYVLIAAGVISIAIGELEDAAFIFVIIFINAAIGTYQEWQAEENASALQNMMKAKAAVLRDGEFKHIEAEQLVKGDIVRLESGTKVPADMRLIQSQNLMIEEALLTGESLPVTKNTEVLEPEKLSIGDKLNMAHAGTIVMSGRGTGIITATASATEIGKIATSLVGSEGVQAPLVKRMESFAQKISIIVLIACTIIGVIGVAVGIEPMEIFFIAVAVAVSAIPEGLPISMTVALSIGTSRMAKRDVIVRKLSAVEGLGSCTYIATDKTGTLTVDQQTAKQIVLPQVPNFVITGEGYKGDGEIQTAEGQKIQEEDQVAIYPLIEAVTFCNEGTLSYDEDQGKWVHEGDAIDVALLALSYKIGKKPQSIQETAKIVGQIPFESANKYAATYFEKDGQTYIAAKGAAEVICEQTAVQDAEKLLKKADDLAQKGYRVIAVAGGKVNHIDEEKLPEGLSFLGFVALIDPIKPEAKTAIATCHEAGIDVAMITGDHPATALSIAQELGMAKAQEEVITGKELYEIKDEDFAQAIEGKHVFARVSPAQKKKIVEALQAKGNFVAVTGDGVNDAPALKIANIGVAMGYGTDVAKDAASIIITDNNFASIAAGVEEGRYTYANLRKIIYLLVSTGAAEVLMVGLALIFGLPLPLIAVQLLWLNLVTNGVQDKALAFEKGDPDIMKEKPRNPNEGIFNPMMLQQVLVAAGTMALLCFGLWYHLINNLKYDEGEARNIIVLLMVMLQNVHVLNCRSETKSIFKMPLKNNWSVLFTIVAAQGIHIGAMHIPFFQNLLSLQPVSIEDWLKLLATASIIIVIIEILKFVRRKKQVA
ncbi:MAG: HAD-IC family P-type ATPase [Bernardetiaceae bacterium]|nr:HAD-IC family P-type ATPase [Bernardetiaceae bacterium]